MFINLLLIQLKLIIVMGVIIKMKTWKEVVAETQRKHPNAPLKKILKLASAVYKKEKK